MMTQSNITLSENSSGDLVGMIPQIRERRDFFLNNARILRKKDPNDHYWRGFDDPSDRERGGELFETGMVLSWIGSHKRPKRIMEIGTRTGGSLINLLSTYSQADLRAVEIVSFDLWREYFSVTWFSRVLTRIKYGSQAEKKGQINISRKYTRYFDVIIKRLATGKVKKNLRYFNIPAWNITFISGDSKQTVPAYFGRRPEKQFDYILVDGAHDEETALIDLENVVNHVAKGGALVFDDIGPESYKLGPVWDTFKERHKDEFDFYEVYHRKGVAWAFKK